MTFEPILINESLKIIDSSQQNLSILKNSEVKTDNNIQITNSEITEPKFKNIKIQENIDSLLKRTGYPLVQENGQRKYGPAPNWLDKQQPDRGCEVFIGKIPRDCFEDELIPLLEKFGFIYEFRLMMEYSGFNRGYGFCMFSSKEEAKKAVLELNNFEIRKGRTLGLCRSVDNCRLFVGGIPKNKKREEILEEMKKLTDNVMNIFLPSQPKECSIDKSKNRGFCFVQYINHRAAAIARRKLISARSKLFGQSIAVDWAEPEPLVDDNIMATVKVLYVRNLMLATTEEQIKIEFEKIKENSIERVKKMKDFAFVHFKERDDCIKALEIMNGSVIDGTTVEVSLSKPVDKTNLIRFTRGIDTSSITKIDFNILLGSDKSNKLLSIPSSNPFPEQNIQYQIPYIQTIENISTISPVQNFNNNFISFQNLPSIIAPNFDISNINYETNNLINRPNSNTGYFNKTLTGRLKTTSNLKSSNGIYRSKFYDTNKNIYENIKNFTPYENILNDYYNGIIPTPVLFPFNKADLNNYNNHNQILQEICLKEGISPIYTLHTTNSLNTEGKEICLYMYKVCLPGFSNGNEFCSNRFSNNLDDAKNEAAEHVLKAIQSIQKESNQNLQSTQVFYQDQSINFNLQQQLFPKLMENSQEISQFQFPSYLDQNGQYLIYP